MNTDFSKKDLTSFHRHDRDYVNVDPKSYATTFKDMDIYQQFDLYGYKTIIESFPLVRSLHIDMGCGGGWLLEKTAPLFERVIGVDPSAAALEGAREVTKNLPNVEFLEADMVEALEKISPVEPIYITTTTVMSHIKDEWVEEFLKAVNNLPKGSILTFGEPHGTNINRPLWYIRSKSWWAERLPNWQLVFGEKKPSGMNYGFIGWNSGKENVVSYHRQSWLEKISWKFSGIYHNLRTKAVNLIKLFY